MLSVVGMNNSVNGSAGMGHNSIMSQSQGYNQSSDNNGWTPISPYSHSPYNASPMNEYGGFNFMPPPSGLPSESIGRMPPPPPPPPPSSSAQHQMHQPQHQPQPSHHHTHHQMIQPAPSSAMTHHQLPMLNTATTTWPSQLANPGSSGNFSAPPLASNQIPSMSSMDTGVRTSPAQDKSARKTLSLEQKRAMCQYHEDHPGKRQADIGAKFGVERR